MGATIAVAPIIATVAEPTAARAESALYQPYSAESVAYAYLRRILHSVSASPLLLRMALNAPPAPIISRMFAMAPEAVFGVGDIAYIPYAVAQTEVCNTPQRTAINIAVNRITDKLQQHIQRAASFRHIQFSGGFSPASGQSAAERWLALRPATA